MSYDDKMNLCATKTFKNVLTVLKRQTTFKRFRIHITCLLEKLFILQASSILRSEPDEEQQQKEQEEEKQPEEDEEDSNPFYSSYKEAVVGEEGREGIEDPLREVRELALLPLVLFPALDVRGPGADSGHGRLRLQAKKGQLRLQTLKFFIFEL